MSNADLKATLARLRALHAEAEAVITHFTEHPVIAAESATEEDARWIMRYDAVREEYRKLGYGEGLVNPTLEVKS